MPHSIKQPIPSIKIVLKYQNKIMMLKLTGEDKIAYDLPGGRMEYGEGIFETLKREVVENDPRPRGVKLPLEKFS